jgi:hypothetical protein
MSTSTDRFDRNTMANWYATQHLRTDPGVVKIYYLPTNAPEREIRLLEVNELIAEMKDDTLEPIDFGVDVGSENEHKLFVLDVTPSQWDSMHRGTLRLPSGWSLDGHVAYENEQQ